MAMKLHNYLLITYTVTEMKEQSVCTHVHCMCVGMWCVSKDNTNAQIQTTQLCRLVLF